MAAGCCGQRRRRVAFMAEPALRTPRVLRVGTDFSGLDTAVLALKRLDLPMRVQFVSDCDPACQRLLRALHKPKALFTDVLARTPDEEEPVHLYITTPPCQSYSSSGKRKGVADARGRVVSASMQYVHRRRPRVVVLENVTGFTHKKHQPVFRGILKALTQMGYHTRAKILNARKYKVAQDRRRVFIVAIRRDSLRRPFKWPRPTGKRTLTEVLDPLGRGDKARRLPRLERPKRMARLAFAKIWAGGVDPGITPCAVDVGCSEKYLTWGVDISRTLCRGRAASGGFWVSTRSRRMTTTELMRVPGVHPSELTGWEECCTKSQLGQMLGNCVPVPLIGAVLQSALWSGGLRSMRRPFPDRA